MFRFTIKSLMYMTTVVAAYALVLASAIDGSISTCIAGLAMLAILISGKISYDIIRDRKGL